MNTICFATKLSSGERSASEMLERLGAGEFSKKVLLQALSCRGDDQLRLFALAREKRQEFFPANSVEVRSVIELSNVCVQNCSYCGMGRAGDKTYLISQEECTALASHLYGQGRRLLLLQSGENPSQTFVDHVTACVRAIKASHPQMGIVLCLGNLERSQYQQLKSAGADRYVLKYETSNPSLYSAMKPKDSLAHRIACMETLLELGFKLGSGNIIGLPGQALDDIVNDLQFNLEFDLSMVSSSAFIPGENSRLRNAPVGNGDLALNSIALQRIMNPGRLIPTTSPLERIKPHGQCWGLMAGANTVTIHDGTPEHFRAMFPIYSGHRFTPNSDHLMQCVRDAGMTPSQEPLL